MDEKVTVIEQQMDCPYCAEKISKKAKKCRHCGEILDQQMRDIEALKQQRNLIVNNNNNNNASNGKATYPWGFHLFLTLITGGAWGIVWLIMYLLRDRNVYN